MPSRFAFFSSKEEIKAKFNVEIDDNIELHPYYNLKPTNRTTAIINNDGLHLVRMKWGYINSMDQYKARAETIHQKNLFKKAFKERRCVVLANGFFEWVKEDKKSIPYYFSIKNEPLFPIAGIYNNHVDDESGEMKYQVAVVTTEANNVVAQIFHRMPVILNLEEFESWLDQNESEENLLKILKPYKANEMQYWKVKPLPARGDNGPATIKPAKKESKKGGLTDFL